MKLFSMQKEKHRKPPCRLKCPSKTNELLSVSNTTSDVLFLDSPAPFSTLAVTLLGFHFADVHFFILKKHIPKCKTNLH